MPVVRSDDPPKWWEDALSERECECCGTVKRVRWVPAYGQWLCDEDEAMADEYGPVQDLDDNGRGQ